MDEKEKEIKWLVANKHSSHPILLSMSTNDLLRMALQINFYTCKFFSRDFVMKEKKESVSELDTVR